MMKGINKQEQTKDMNILRISTTRAHGNGTLIKISLIMVLAIMLLGACGAKTANNSAANSSSTASTAAKPAVGDAVVAKYKTGAFAEGKVQSIAGEKAKIDWVNKELESMDVDLAHVYAIPKAGVPAPAKADDYVLANTSTYKDAYWYEVQIANVNGATVSVKEKNNYVHDTTSDQIIALSPADSAEIKAMFDKFKKQDDFVERSHKTKPVVPSDFKPKVGDTVVAQIPNSDWNTGKIKSISGDKATVVWDEKNNYSYEAALDQMAPLSAAPNAPMPAVGDFVLIKSGYQQIWEYAEVTSVNGTSLDVKNKFDTTKTVKQGEFIPLKK